MDFSSLSTLSTVALYAATFAFAFVSGIIPFVLNIELYLLAVAALTDASAVPSSGWPRRARRSQRSSSTSSAKAR